MEGKHRTKYKLLGLNVAYYRKRKGFSQMQFLDDAERLLGYPMVIKESNGSFGKQVYLAENKKQALKIIKKIGHKRFLMQEFIRESRGRDIRVNVVGGKVICAILRENKRDFRSNVSSGGVAKRVCLTAEQEQIALDACKAVGADFAGVDVLLSKNGALICEVNSNPHFKSTYDCTGVDLSEYITALVAERI